MKAFSSLFIMLALVFSTLNMQAQEFFADADAFIASCVENGLVDYDGIAEDRSQLDKLVEQIDSYKPKSDLSDYAFYLNAYNITVIKSVLDNRPIASPMDVKGFFDGVTHTIAGKTMTLNQLENELIRPVYQDARIHFALVCGAIGCPPIANTAFSEANIGSLLNKRTRLAMDNERFIQVDDTNKTVGISKIFEWYRGDFADTDAGILQYINKYRSNAIPEGYSITYYEYDWTLNGQ